MKLARIVQDSTILYNYYRECEFQYYCQVYEAFNPNQNCADWDNNRLSVETSLLDLQLVMSN